MSDRRMFLKGLVVGMAGLFAPKAQEKVKAVASPRNEPVRIGPWDTVALFNEKGERIGECVAKNYKVVVTWADSRSTEVTGSD